MFFQNFKNKIQPMDITHGLHIITILYKMMSFKHCKNAPNITNKNSQVSVLKH